MPVSTQENIQESLASLERDPALSQKDFYNIVLAFAFHSDQGRFLHEITARNRKMTETLLVFRKRLAEAIAQGRDLEPLVDRIFLHYVVNTDGPIIECEDDDPFDVFDAATRYAEWLHVGVSKGQNGGSMLHIDEKVVPYPECDSGWSAAWSLRKVGTVINRVRYGRNYVIPSIAFGFDENAEGHTLENALTLADCAHLVYFKAGYVEKQLKTWGYETFRWIEDVETDTQLFVAGRDQHLVVCFRGTSSATDAMVDFKLLKTEAFGGRGKVHWGFNIALNSVWSRVQAAVDELGVGKKLFLCGHSLGAAHAQLAGHRFALLGYDVAHIYVYGSPRLANREFRDAYNELLGTKTFVHINNQDIITQMPLEILGYYHLGGAPRCFNHGHVINYMPSPMSATEAGYEEMELEMLEMDKQEEIKQQILMGQQTVLAFFRFLTTDPSEMSTFKYETQFEAGAVDEHRIDQYVFKFACAIVDGEWERIGKAAQ